MVREFHLGGSELSLWDLGSPLLFGSSDHVDNHLLVLVIHELSVINGSLLKAVFQEDVG